MNPTRWIDTSRRNLRHALRALGKAPTFSAAVVLTLALGIGANTAVFSAIDAVLLRPLPFPDADRLVHLAQVHPTTTQPFLAPVRLQDWERLNSTLHAISGYYMEDVSELSGEVPEKLTRATVAPRFLEVWGIRPALGRDFNEHERRFGGPRAVLISDGFWLRRFNRDPAAVGRTLRLGQASVAIVGVMPRTFRFPVRNTDLWGPAPMDAPYAQGRELTWFTGIGRLKPGVTLAHARANLAAVQAGLGREHPKTDAALAPDVRLLKEAEVGDVRRSLWVLFGSVSLLLIIACSNIAALLLSRAAGRQHEIALRASLGASRSSVVALLLTEVLVLAVAGAGLGLLVARGAVSIIRDLARTLPRADEMVIDWRVGLYSLGCALGVTLLCGLAPALRASRAQVTGVLAQADRTLVSGRHPIQFVLVGVQVALAVLLLVGAGLLARSFQELGRVSPGFDPRGVLTFHITGTWGEAADAQGGRRRAERIVEAVASLPGVQAVSTSFSLPGVPDEYQMELKPAEGRAESEPQMLVQARGVSSAYFATMRIPILAGELCREEATTATVMVNRRFVEVYSPAASPIGRRLLVPNEPRFPALEIRGVVADARDGGLDREPVPTVYMCSVRHQPNTYFLVRTAGEPSSLVEAIRRRVKEVEPLRSVHGITPLLDHIGDTRAETRLRTFLLVLFAVTAVSLASVGLYGTLSFLVQIRRREIALRLALGAGRGRVVCRIAAQGLSVAGLGVAAGLGMAAASGKVLTGMLYGVSTSDPATVLGVVGLVLTVSAASCLVPAVRASRLDPMRILRET